MAGQVKQRRRLQSVLFYKGHGMTPTTLVRAITITTLLAVGAPSAMSAQPSDGPYLWLGAGRNRLQNQDIAAVGTPFGRQPGGNIKANDGTIAAVSVGWGFSNGVRLELETSYRKNGFHEATAGSLRQATAGGDETKSGIFFNALYQFDRTGFGISPYVGFGAGRIRTKWDEVVAFNAAQSVRLNDRVSDSAYQAIVGFSFLDHLVPGMSFTAEYRLLRLDGGRAYAGQVERSRFGAFPISTVVERNQNHAFLIGMRYEFGGGRK
jgi:OOP family OmpA-OmpF porin